MSTTKIIALCCTAAAGLAVLPEAKAETRPVNQLPEISHVNATVVIVRHRHHRRGHWVYRHHRRVWVTNY